MRWKDVSAALVVASLEGNVAVTPSRCPSSGCGVSGADAEGSRSGITAPSPSGNAKGEGEKWTRSSRHAEFRLEAAAEIADPLTTDGCSALFYRRGRPRRAPESFASEQLC